MKNKLLIYDDNCPLCTWYSGAFVKHGYLPPSGRVAYTSLDIGLTTNLDMNRARNEIALIDTESNTTIYGIDSILTILGKKHSWIESAGQQPAIKWFLKRVYKLISYNRKVIVAKKCSSGTIDCVPDINYFYRVLFMIIGLTFNTLLLFPLHDQVFSSLSYYHLNMMQLQLAHFSLVGCNCLLSLYFQKNRRVEYLGQVNMLALIAVLLLLPLYFIRLMTDPGEIFTTLYLSLTTLFILREYIRRMDFAGILAKDKWIVSLNFISLTGFIFFLFDLT